MIAPYLILMRLMKFDVVCFVFGKFKKILYDILYKKEPDLFDMNFLL